MPYNSWGNGAAMRVSPIGYAYDSIEKVLEEAAKSAAISHDHPDGVQSAQAVALSVYLARNTKDKEHIRDEISCRFGYNLSRTLDEIRPGYTFDVSSQGSVPEAIISFLESLSYEDAVRGAISLGGDSDTQACIAGGIAEAFYGPVSGSVFDMVEECLTEELWLIAEKFYRKYCFSVG
jgi:ADP-ribosylglycohydrolase